MNENILFHPHAYQIRSKSKESSVLHQQGEFNGEHDTNNKLQESKAQLFHHPLYLHVPYVLIQLVKYQRRARINYRSKWQQRLVPLGPFTEGSSHNFSWFLLR